MLRQLVIVLLLLASCTARKALLEDTRGDFVENVLQVTRFPWVAFITAKGNVNAGQSVGVIVSKSWILTLSQNLRTVSEVDIYTKVLDLAPVFAGSVTPTVSSKKIVFQNTAGLCATLIKVCPPFYTGSVLQIASVAPTYTTFTVLPVGLSFKQPSSGTFFLGLMGDLYPSDNCPRVTGYDASKHFCVGGYYLSVEFPGSPIFVNNDLIALFTGDNVNSGDTEMYTIDVTKVKTWIETTIAT